MFPNFPLLLIGNIFKTIYQLLNVSNFTDIIHIYKYIYLQCVPENGPGKDAFIRKSKLYFRPSKFGTHIFEGLKMIWTTPHAALFHFKH